MPSRRAPAAFAEPGADVGRRRQSCGRQKGRARGRRSPSDRRRWRRDPARRRRPWRPRYYGPDQGWRAGEEKRHRHSLVRWGESSLVLNEASSVNKTCHNRFGTICMGTPHPGRAGSPAGRPQPLYFRYSQIQGGNACAEHAHPGVSSASSAWGGHGGGGGESGWWRLRTTSSGCRRTCPTPPSTSRPWITPPST